MHALRINDLNHDLQNGPAVGQPCGRKGDRRRVLKAVFSAAVLLLGGGSRGSSLAAEHAGHDHGSERKQGVQSLDAYTDGKSLHVLFGDYREESTVPALMYVRSEDAGATWSPSVRVDEGFSSAHGAQRGMDPQIASNGKSLVAIWMTRGTGLFDSGPMITVISEDGGKTWHAGPNPADDESTSGHGFLDIAADAKGTFHLTWLDDRNDARGLRYARSTDAGKSWSANVTVDPKTCECCWNTLAVGSEGEVAILFRDQQPRDMRVAVLPGVTSEEASWLPSRAVGKFEWDFQGCPHVGGGLAFGPEKTGSELHATIWTGRNEKTGVYYLKSGDQGRTWSEPSPVGDGRASHPDLAVRGDGRVRVVWDASGDGVDRAIWSASSSDGGKNWSAPDRLSAAGVAATHPRILPAAEGFRVFWTEKAPDSPASAWKSVAVK